MGCVLKCVINLCRTCVPWRQSCRFLAVAPLDWWECDAEKQMARYWWYCHTGRPLSAHSGSAGQGECGTGWAFDKCGFCHGEVYFCPGDDKTHCVRDAAKRVSFESADCCPSFISVPAVQKRGRSATLKFTAKDMNFCSHVSPNLYTIYLYTYLNVWQQQWCRTSAYTPWMYTCKVRTTWNPQNILRERCF